MSCLGSQHCLVAVACRSNHHPRMRRPNICHAAWVDRGRCTVACKRQAPKRVRAKFVWIAHRFKNLDWICIVEERDPKGFGILCKRDVTEIARKSAQIRPCSRREQSTMLLAPPAKRPGPPMIFFVKKKTKQERKKGGKQKQNNEINIPLVVQRGAGRADSFACQHQQGRRQDRRRCSRSATRQPCCCSRRTSLPSR